MKYVTVMISIRKGQKHHDNFSEDSFHKTSRTAFNIVRTDVNRIQSGFAKLECQRYEQRRAVVHQESSYGF